MNASQEPDKAEGPNDGVEYYKAAGAVGAGAAVGAGVSAVVGSMGLTVAGTAVAVGMAPMIAAGAVVGLAGYGVWRLVSK